MNLYHDTSKARFGGWSTSAILPPGVRDPSVKAADYAYQYLKELIVTMELAPQTIITEVEVAEATGVSRTPVREAFFRLQAEKLLDPLPRRGALVPAITLRNIQEQAQTRLVLEGYGIQQICKNKMPVLEELSSLIAEQKAVLESDPDKVVEMVLIDKEFHWTLIKAVGNTEFSQLYNALHDKQVRIGIAKFRAVKGRACNAISEHNKIYEALIQYDVETAQQRLEEHLLGSLNQISSIFTN
ncbi:GntR family transcriptional regulator [Brevibacterium zhoupengii]|uniref:GntR family transcriptional regulator n=1 Tax=Brevibacterium zhoupengii TaxID=2898795 RepID=UPI001E641C29|nr:GntR family transcriptional regulator [Brevibacterium zhoupengii]